MKTPEINRTSAIAQSAAVIALFEIIELDARPLLAVASLAQAYLTRHTSACIGPLLNTVFRFRDTYHVELAFCHARTSTRDANVYALIRQGVPALVAQQFMDTETRQLNATLMRLDVSEFIALINPLNGYTLITHPDVALISIALPAAKSLLAAMPQTPVAKPASLTLSDLQSLPERLDCTALRHLYVPSSAILARGLEQLGSLNPLHTLQLANAATLAAAVLARLPISELTTLILSDLDDSPALQHWLNQLRCLKRLRVHRMHFGALHLLSALSSSLPLQAIDVQSFELKGPPGAHWHAFWQHATTAIDLRLAFIDEKWLAAVLAAPMPNLQKLAISGDLGPGALEQLARANLNNLTDLDLTHTRIDGPTLQAFVNQHALPKLRGIAINLFGEHTEAWCDWNGAVVGHGNVRLDHHEIESRYLVGSGVRVIPAFTSDW